MDNTSLIEPYIASQFPSFYQSEGQNFIEFVKAYYRWLETYHLIIQTNEPLEIGSIIRRGNSSAEVIALIDPEQNLYLIKVLTVATDFKRGILYPLDSGQIIVNNPVSANPLYYINKLKENSDIDTMMDEFLRHMSKKYLAGVTLPNEQADITRNLVKNSSKIFANKGSSEGTRLFFSLIYNSDTDIFYPGEMLLIPSEGEWVNQRYLEITYSPRNKEFKNQRIYGKASGMEAFVDDYYVIRIKNSFVYILLISGINGSEEFTIGENIGPVDDKDNSFLPKIRGSATSLEVILGGDGFVKGDEVIIDSSTGRSLSGIVSKLSSVTGQIEFELLNGGWGYTTTGDLNYSQEELERRSKVIVSKTILEVDNIYTGNILSSVEIINAGTGYSDGDIVEIHSPIGQNGLGIIYTNAGVISEIVLSNHGTGFDRGDTNNYTITSNGSGAVLNFKTDFARKHFELFDTVTGKLGEQVGTPLEYVITVSGNASGYSIQNILETSSGSGTIIDIVKFASNIYQFTLKNVTGTLNIGQNLKNSNIFITNLSAIIGFDEHDVWEVNDEVVLNLAGTSANVINVGQGSGANFDILSIRNTSPVEFNINFLKYTIKNNIPLSQIPVVNEDGSLVEPSAVYNTTAIIDTLSFQQFNVGEIASIGNLNPGTDYSIAPPVFVYQPYISQFNKIDYVLSYESASNDFMVGEIIRGVSSNIIGKIKNIDYSLRKLFIERMNFSGEFMIGEMITGDSSGFTALIRGVESDPESLPIGLNASLDVKQTFSNSIAKEIQVIDSGFGYNEIGSQARFIGVRNGMAGSLRIIKSGIGRGKGYYKTSPRSLSDKSYLRDAEYYHEFAYDIITKIPFEDYKDIFKDVMHKTGYRLFGTFSYNGEQIQETNEGVTINVN